MGTISNDWFIMIIIEKELSPNIPSAGVHGGGGKEVKNLNFLLPTLKHPLPSRKASR